MLVFLISLQRFLLTAFPPYSASSLQRFLRSLNATARQADLQILFDARRPIFPCLTTADHLFFNKYVIILNNYWNKEIIILLCLL